LASSSKLLGTIPVSLTSGSTTVPSMSTTS
jgi:hypothetical protein